MTTTTSNYGLFKYVSSTDSALAFNITSALNNNWDKLDTYAVRRSSTSAVGSTTQPVYVNSSGVVTAANAYSTISGGLTATVSLSENGYIKFSNNIIINYGIGVGGTYTTLAKSYNYYYGVGSTVSGDSVTSVSCIKISNKTIAGFTPHTTWVSKADSAGKEMKYNFYYVCTGY